MPHLAPLLRYSDLLAQNRKFCPPALIYRHSSAEPLRIYEKAVRFLKLESTSQPTVKIW